MKMILIVDDATFAAYQNAKEALKIADEKNPYSSYQTSMKRVQEIERCSRAREAVLRSLRVPTASDRKALFDATDSLRSKPKTAGPKPNAAHKDPLSK